MVAVGVADGRCRSGGSWLSEWRIVGLEDGSRMAVGRLGKALAQRVEQGGRPNAVPVARKQLRREPRVEVWQPPPLGQGPHPIAERRSVIEPSGPTPSAEQRTVLGEEVVVHGLQPVQVPPLAYPLLYVTEREVVRSKETDVGGQAVPLQHVTRLGIE